VANYNMEHGRLVRLGWVESRGGESGGVRGEPDRSHAEFMDRAEQTVVASEVETYQAVLTACDLSTVWRPGSIPVPTADPDRCRAEYRSGACTLKTTAHAEWVDGQAPWRRGSRPPGRPRAGPGWYGRRSMWNLVGRGEKSAGRRTVRSRTELPPRRGPSPVADGSVRFVKSRSTVSPGGPSHPHRWGGARRRQF